MKTKLNHSTKAISKVISVLLMIAIAIAAALIAYAWLMGYTTKTTQTTEKAIQITSVEPPATGGSWLTLYVQNVGKGTVNLKQDTSAYVNDILHKITESPQGTIIAAEQLLPIEVGQTIQIVTDYWYMPGTTIKIKIVTIEGTFAEITIHGAEAADDSTTPPETKYTLTVHVDGSGAVTKNPNKAKYNPDETVQLIPSTSVGWQFDHWSGDLSGSANPGTITMDSDKTVTATFTQKTYELEISKNGEGNITKNPDKTSYYLGEQVTLTATPADGWSFAGWTGDKTSTNNQITLTIDETPQITATFTRDLYSLTVTINPSEGGSVTRNNTGPYDLNDIVTLNAEPATGYTFTGWTGDLTSTTNPDQITITGNMIVTANFEKITVTLTLNANPESGGSITPNTLPPYKYGDTVQLTAITNIAYSFSGWSDDLTGIANPTWITLNGDKTVTANFIQNEYGLIIHTDGNGTVNRNPDQATYHYGDHVTLTATPDDGWSFAGWTGDVTSPDNQITLTIDETPEVTATFTQTQYSLTVTINPAGAGTVTKNPTGPAYAYGTVVTVTASANPGFRFTGWTGDISGTTNPSQVTITGNMIVTANFEKIPVTLTLNVNPSGGGTATSSPSGQHYYGDTVQLTATAAAGYEFDNWTGDITSSNNPATITLNGNKTVTANFNRKTYTLTINIDGSGTVTKNPDQTTYYYGDEVELTADPADNWDFAGWSGAVTGTSTTVTATIFDNTEVTATFTQTQYSLTVTPNPAGAGTVTKNPTGPTYTYGTVVTLTPSAATGYHFVNWGGHLTGTANPGQITITGNMIVTANFEPNPVTLTLNVNPAGAGTITPSSAGPYYYGDTIQLTANPTAGYTFDSWTGGLTGSSNPATITLTGDTTVTANFAFYTGFDGTPWDQGWNNWANPPWYEAAGEGYLGTDAAASTSSTDGPFSSNAIDTRSANTIAITFKWKVQNTESSDLNVLYSYIQNPNSGGHSPDFHQLREIGTPTQVSEATALGDGWYQLTITLTRDSTPNAFSQYFRLRFESNLSSSEKVWVDDIQIALT